MEGTTEDQNLEVVSENLDDRRVGDIWDLKVSRRVVTIAGGTRALIFVFQIFRDPTATPSA